MKTFLERGLRVAVICLVASFVSGLCPWLSRAENQPRPKASAAATNAAPVQLIIPKSVFIIPSTPQEGTDPFFPKAYRRAEPVVRSPTPIATSDLHLKGFSGTSDNRLAIINNHTLATGEEADLTLGGRRVRVRCVEIKADSVVIEVAGQRQELRLRQGL